MANRILLTGATGFIGSNVARLLIAKKTNFTAIVRPGTSTRRLKFLANNVELIKIDLADTQKLRSFLNHEKFDTIIHIGALRGGKKYPKRIYYDTNVKATEQIAEVSLKNESKLLFCSSVGVYGAIPQELPATVKTQYQGDNVYHDTKIKAESIIQKHALAGLKAVIIRPAITYGEDDYGFPYTLVKLVHRKLIFLPDITKIIHLANIDIVADAFYKLAEDEFRGNKIYNIA
jgi:nucleoside-diphosphate-sugar epimerase